MSKFKNSLEIGKQGEKIIRNKLAQFGFNTEDSNIKEIDFTVSYTYPMFGKIAVTCECKYDIYANKSGNIAIEVFNTKLVKPSGIMSTKCYFWFHVLSDNEIYFALVKSLKKWVKNTKPKRIIMNGGDSNATLYLYDKVIICDEIMQILNKENFIEAIGVINV